MNKKSFQQICGQHDGLVSDKWESYLSIYDHIGAEIQDLPVRLLEIGVQNGGSLELWKEYFIFGQLFVGCDINPECADINFNDKRIRIVVGDVTSDKVQNEILNISSSFDMIIDDGSHKSSDIVKTFTRYFPYLNDKGIYIVEDLHCSYWKNFEGGLYNPLSSLAFFKRLTDVLNHEHWGVSKKSTDILKGFFDEYNCKIDNESLQHIHSIKFYNSICIIKKSKPKFNVLGTRRIIGETEVLASGHKRVNYSYIEVPIQNENKWSTMDKSPDEEHFELVERAFIANEKLSEIQNTKNEIKKQVEKYKSILYTKEKSISELKDRIIAYEGKLGEQKGILLERKNNINEFLIKLQKCETFNNDNQCKLNECYDHVDELKIKIEKKSEEICKLRKRLTSYEELIRELKKKIINWEKQEKKFEYLVDNSKKENEKVKKIIEVRDAQINELRIQIEVLNRRIDEKNSHIKALLNSRSWRISYPIRFVSIRVRDIIEKGQKAKNVIINLSSTIWGIPSAVSRWGFIGLAKRILIVLNESGLNGLFERVKAFRIIRSHKINSHNTNIECQSVVFPYSATSHDERSGYKIVYIVNEHDLMTQRYRVYNYSEELTSYGFTSYIYDSNEIVNEKILNEADILVLNRIAWNNEIGRLIQHFKKNGLPVVFDIDDFLIDYTQVDLLRYTNSMPSKQRELIISLMQGLEITMNACDFVTVSTHSLRCEVEKRGSPAFILPNNIGIYALDLAKDNLLTKNDHSNEKIIIGYFSGTKTHEKDFMECVEGLRCIFQSYSKAELLIAGHLDLPKLMLPYENRIKSISLMPHDEMLRELAKIDINIAPLEKNNRFTDCKSELKIFEAALFEIPSVASPTSTFSAIIENGKNGFLAESPADWYSSLSLLIREKDLRRKIGKEAKKSISSRFSIKNTVHEAISIYTTAIKGRIRQNKVPFESKDSHKEQPLISIVSVLYRKENEVRHFLETLRQQDILGHFEIILVDDCSPDNSVKIVEEFFKWAQLSNSWMNIKLIKNNENLGNCRSRNAAINQAIGKIIVVVDADCILNRAFLSLHAKAHEKGDCDVAIGPLNIETDGESPISILGKYEVNSELAEKDAIPQDSVNLDSFVNCVTRNFSIKRKFIEEHFEGKLFDEEFTYSADPQTGFGWEDVEMGYRIYEAGGKIKYLKETVSIHVTHGSSANEIEKPIRSLKNFRLLLEKHPEILKISRQWSLKTYGAISEWARSTGNSLDENADYRWLESNMLRYKQSPIIIKNMRRLRILTHRWHVPHQYELYRLGHDFTLVTGTGTALCDSWESDKRPIPKNAYVVPVTKIDTRDYDVAILHFDENILNTKLCHGKVPEDWGLTFKWFIENVNLPKVAVCHGTPQFIGQYNKDYNKADLYSVYENERKAIVELLGDIPVICNSHQARFEWGFRNSATIWHGFSPHEYPNGSHDRGVLVMLKAAMENRPHYNGLSYFENVQDILGERIKLNCLDVPNPANLYVYGSQEWAIAKYQNYVREIGRYSIYFNPTIRSPMPRARGEAMMAGLVTVSLRNHDVELFIKNGINGFFADTSEELAEQILWLSMNHEKLATISVASRNTAVDTFNQDRYLGEWSRILKNIIG